MKQTSGLGFGQSGVGVGLAVLLPDAIATLFFSWRFVVIFSTVGGALIAPKGKGAGMMGASDGRLGAGVHDKLDQSTDDYLVSPGRRSTAED
jgi:hypothetical protein